MPLLFPEMKITTPQVVDQLRSEYERLHDLPPDLDPEVREAYYRDHIVANPARQRSRRRWTSGVPSGSGPRTRSRCGTSRPR